MSFAMLNAITDPKENVNASPDIFGLLWSILVFRNFPSKYEVVHINVLTSFSSWKDSFWVLTQQGAIRTGRRSSD